MRLIALFVTLSFFSISVADANQHAVLKAQWQVLKSQGAQLNYAEKLEKVQSLTSFVSLDYHHSTKLSNTPSQIFESEQATSAEVAYIKWQMLVALGSDPDAFRMVYTMDEQGQELVWLSIDQGGVVQLIAPERIISQTEFNKLLLYKQISVVSVVDPKRVMASRDSARSTGHQIGDRVVL